MANLAIIPARGGSKRIPGKNIKPFLGKPIIAYSIETAVNSGLFDEVMVSTDNKEIAEVARSYGASIPYLRSSKNADDYAILVDVILEVLYTYKDLGKEFDTVCCILPTAPFISSELIGMAFDKMFSGGYASVFPIIEYSFPIQRSLNLRQNNLQMVWPEYLNSRSQDLEKRYHDSGQFYWLKTEAFLSEKKLYSSNMGAIIISPLQAQDIDVETDWKLAELKYKLMLDEKKNSL